MRPKSISASALLNYKCPSKFYAENVLKTPSPSGDAANLGTSCHAALEVWVKGGYHLRSTNFAVLQTLYTAAYWQLFSDESMFDDGLQMLERWYNRQDFSGVTVISTEEKRSFELPVSDTETLTFNYIIDRFDLRHDGIPVVVDYKSIREPLSPDQLKNKIQARAYGVGAQMQYPDAPGVWVIFDLLRYDTVGVYFTKEENRASYLFLAETAKRIWEDEPDEATDNSKVWPREILNEGCRYCIRRSECDSLVRYATQGGLVGLNLSDLAEDEVAGYIDERAKMKWAMDALKSNLSELDSALTDYLYDGETTSAEGIETTVKIVNRSSTDVDPHEVRQIVPSEILLEYFSPGATAINKIAKDDRLTDEQKSMLKQAVRKVPGGRYLKSANK